MNPAFLNYLQMQQMSNGQQEASAPQAQATYNPFDAGISKAIASARESLGMTDKQQEKALRRSMLTFADNMAAQPKQKGFFNNFGSAARALSPAIMEHDNAEEAAFTQNNQLANQILAYKAAEEAKQAKLEEQAWRRQHEEAKLAEQSRYHDSISRYQQAKLQGQQISSDTPLDGDFIPFANRSERLMYSKEKKASGEILRELSSIKKDYESFRELAKDDVIDPMTPYGVGKVANTAKDFFGYFNDNKALQEETKKRKALDAKLGKFAVELERKIKGGVLSEAMIKRFENKELLPSLSDRPEVFEEKLNNLYQEMDDRYKASDASLRYGVHISPYDLESKEQPPNGEVSNSPGVASTEQEWVIMVDPVTGERKEVFFEDIPIALKKELKRE